MTTKTWTVLVSLSEDDDDTRAEAVLDMDNKLEMRAQGFSRKNPSDESDARIGDELACARALSQLAHELLEAAARNIEQHTHQPVRSLSL